MAKAVKKASPAPGKKDDKGELGNKEYATRDEEAAHRAREAAGVGEARRAQGLHRLRGPRHGRQGRDDQGDHRAREPAHLPRRGAARALGPGKVADVLPALHAAPAGRGRGRDLRPQLLQPRRRRARDGLLRREDREEVPRGRPEGREVDGRLRDHPHQVLAGGERRGADEAAFRAHRRRAQDLEAHADGPQVVLEVVRLLARPRRHVQVHPHRVRALDRRRLQRQEAGAPEHHQRPPLAHPLQVGAARRRSSCPSARRTRATASRSTTWRA